MKSDFLARAVPKSLSEQLVAGQNISAAWLKRVPAAGRFATVDGAVLTLDDLTARDYVESDPLDLDHLSSRDK